MVQEYASVTAWHGDDRIYCYFGLLAVAIVCTGLLLRQGRFVEPLWILVLGYAAYHSARHIPIFVIAAVPIIAATLTSLWKAYAGRLNPSSTVRVIDSIFDSMTPQFSRISLWALAVLGLIFAADLPKEFPRYDYPIALMERDRALLAQSRLFSTDHWGDYLIYRYYPGQNSVCGWTKRLLRPGHRHRLSLRLGGRTGLARDRGPLAVRCVFGS